ncbi:MAG TPA: TetR/AcrR family transcriptional regulator [Gryllotalpicola sp.]
MAVERGAERARAPYGKSTERRQQILDSAIEIFAREGVDAGSYRSVAAAIGVSHTALRYYFPTREELLIAVYRAHEHREDDEEWLGTAPSPVAALQESAARNRAVPGLVKLYAALVSDAVQAGHLASRAFIGRRFAQIRQRIARRVRLAQEQGAYPGDANADDISSLIIAASDGLQLQWLLDPDEVDVEKTLAVLNAALATRDAS